MKNSNKCIEIIKEKFYGVKSKKEELMKEISNLKEAREAERLSALEIVKENK